MEGVLEAHKRPRDPGRPVACVDETSKKLVGETRVPIPSESGRPARNHYEYECNGTANLFMIFGPLEGWRHVALTDHHTTVECAHSKRGKSVGTTAFFSCPGSTRSDSVRMCRHYPLFPG
jgi:hypothetical protein